MSATDFVDICGSIAVIVLILAFALIIVRIIVGPTLADRILGLDMLVSVGIGFIAVIGVQTGYYLYVDVAIGLALVGFLATVAFARFVLSRGATSEAGEK